MTVVDVQSVPFFDQKICLKTFHLLLTKGIEGPKKIK